MYVLGCVRGTLMEKNQELVKHLASYGYKRSLYMFSIVTRTPVNLRNDLDMRDCSSSVFARDEISPNLIPAECPFVRENFSTATKKINQSRKFL